jgi:uncharacterized membrane protein
MLKALFALVAAALFAGAALYISLAEHPARMKLDNRSALAQWNPSYRAATPLMAGLALLSLVLGAWAWWKIGDDWLLAGALLIGAVVPLTLVLVLPINRRLLATTADSAGEESRTLLARWGRLHALRTVLALAAVAAYLVAFLWP